MLFRQLFDDASFTYTYLVADEASGQALLIDPVLERVELYCQLLEELGLSLAYAIDTHVHADHITALGLLRERLGCHTVHGRESRAVGVSLRVGDGDRLMLGELPVCCLYTPGHTDDSYSFYLPEQGLLFTGDTLLIRGTGRTDFQHGDAETQYQSLFSKLFLLPDDTVVYPGHDYRGMTRSTLGEERRHNPRLQVKDAGEYAALMAGLKLAPPRAIKQAVPANLRMGLQLQPG